MNDIPASPAPINVADLELREITRDAPDAIKRKLISEEAVHPLDAADPMADLTGRRMSADTNGAISDKHCFALFAKGSDEPQVAVYVRLYHLPASHSGKVHNTNLPGDIGDILGSPARPVTEPNTAIFYTITSMVNLPLARGGDTPGETLIKKVAGHLQEKYGISKFSTLSPLRAKTGEAASGFRQWAKKKIDEDPERMLTAGESGELRRIAGELKGRRVASAAEAFDDLIANPDGWGEHAQRVRDIIKDLALTYLAVEKRENGAAIDPVANFHLRNGGMIGKLHVLPTAETTASEMQGSLGVMVNYVYEPERLEARKKEYGEGKITLDPNLQIRLDERRRHFRKSEPDRGQDGAGMGGV